MSITTCSCILFKDGRTQEIEDKVACEEEIEVFWPAAEPVQLWSMPQELEELVLGSCATELCPPESQPLLEERRDSRFYLRPTPREESVEAKPCSPTPELIFSCMQELLFGAGKWEETGCFHRAAVFDMQGGLLRMNEDISRHNCINRLCGWAINNQQSLAGRLLCVSARGTASIVSKAIKAGITAMACRAAVTTAAVELADRHGMILIGFVRENRFTLFSDSEGRFAA
jgi:FdhD protein